MNFIIRAARFGMLKLTRKAYVLTSRLAYRIRIQLQSAIRHQLNNFIANQYARNIIVNITVVFYFDNAEVMFWDSLRS